MQEALEQIDIEGFIAALQKDYSKLSARIRELTHSVSCDYKGVTLRLHFPSINNGKPAVWELINAILDYLTPFALPRKQIEELANEYGTLSPEEFRVRCERQQREAISLFIRAQRVTNRNGEAGELLLFLLHPTDHQAYYSYSNILELCHEIILCIDTSRNLHQFHAALARYWMLGWSIPRIVNHQIRRERRKGRNPDIRKIIRDVLRVIEEDIRFQTIRLFACYNSILEFALSSASDKELVTHIPDVALFLEVGASNQTTISLISIGLSRAVAIKLNGARDELDAQLNSEQALEWLRSHSSNLEALGLSNLQIAEVIEVLSNSSNRPRSQ